MSDRVFEDLVRQSPGGRLRFEAKKTPVTEPPGDQFVCELHAEGSPAPVWRLPLRSEVRLTNAFVHDAGWVVMVDARARLLVADPRGNPVGEAFPLIVPRRLDRHLVWSTAYRLWDDGARFSFVEADSRVLFRVSSWWGRHILLDVQSGEAVTPTEPLQGPLDDELRADVRAFVSGMGADEYRTRAPEAVVRTALVAGTLGVAETVPFLRELEASEHGRSEHVAPFWYKLHPLRQLARLSLRRLEQPLAGPPPIVLGVAGESSSFRAPPDEFAVRVGATIGDAVDALGAPERIEDARDQSAGIVWEWDVDVALPYTLQIRWRETFADGARVADIRRVAPRSFASVDCFQDRLYERAVGALTRARATPG